jgi:ABC-type branched-subunit amino acid transport system ATPase component
MTNREQPWLHIRGLVKSFGGLTAVDHLDLDVWSNEIVSIIGPNGSGKTTTFNLISGVLKPDQGQIEIDGHNIAGERPDQICKLGIARTFQMPELFNPLSVREHLLIGMQRHLHSSLFSVAFKLPNARKEEIEAQAHVPEALRVFGERLTEDRLEDRGISLSYANRRRLEIARAISSEPKLLMLDEPTAGMNPYETKELMHLIEKLRDMGNTVLFIEHDMDVVLNISDRVVALDHGKKIAEGKPYEVANHPEVVEAYLGGKE